jgi:hypothetical protein
MHLTNLKNQVNMKRFLAFLPLILLFARVFGQINNEDRILISPTDKNIQYVGRINFSHPEKPVIYWPGTYIISKFQGKSIGIKLNDENGNNFFNAIIDGDDTNPVIIDCEKGEKTYLLATGLKDTIHHFELFKRTETWEGSTSFEGILLDKGRKLLVPPTMPDFKIEFYGNSITSGMGDEDTTRMDNDNLSKKNNYLAYGAITARNLNAQYHCISKSGIGIMISWFDQVMPELYYRLDPNNKESKWNFASWIPNIVVINLYQNDSWLVNDPDHDQFKKCFPDGNAPTSEFIIQSYINFVNKIRTQYPNAHIICALGNMDATSPGKPWQGYIEAAVKRIASQSGDRRIYTCFFPYKKTAAHPTVIEQAAMAKQLTAFIKANILPKLQK